ncbi:hypothetical protein BH10PLA1_BH10PLA1_00940 [soil metagenome]
MQRRSKMKSKRSRAIDSAVAATAALLIFQLSSVRASDGTWTQISAGNASGTWSNALTANWSGGTVADGSGFTADFSTLDITATSTISLGASRTIGNLNFGDTDAATSATWVLNNGGNSANILMLAGSTPTISVVGGTTANTTISAVIDGTNGLTKTGNGTLVLSAANTYTNGTNVSAGFINVGNATALGGGDVTVTSGAGLRMAGTFTLANNINLNGTSALTQLSGTTILSGNTTLQSNSSLILTGGTLTLGGNLSVGANTFTVANSSGTQNFSLTAKLIGTGVINLANLTGTTTITNDNTATFSGQIQITRSTVAVGNDGAFGSGNILLGVNDQASGIRSTDTTTRTIATLLGFTGSTNSTYVFGSTNATLNGNLTFTNTGNITLGQQTRKLLVNDTTTLAGSLVGGAGVGLTMQTGTGTLVLSGINAYAGATTISAGTLQLGDGTTDGDIATSSSIVNNSALVFNRSTGSSFAYGNAISGNGTITKSGAGTQILSGSNTYSGGTAINAGSVTARNATALGNGTVTVASGAGLNYAATANTALTLGGNLSVTSGTGTAIGGSIGSTVTSAQINVAGNATTTAAAIKVNVYGISGVTPGTNTYTLLHGGASSTLNAATYSLGTVYNNTNFTVGALSGNSTDLQVATTSATALTAAYWTGGLSGATNVWAASDGSANSNWVTSASGGATALVPGAGADLTISANTVVSAPTAANGTVLGADMTIKTLTIADTTNGLGLNADGYTLTITPSSSTTGITVNASVPASTIASNVILGGNQTWTNNSGNALTVSGVVSGASSLTKAGSGTLVLSSTNTYTGNTTISNGTVSASSITVVGGGSNLGNATSAVILGDASNKGTLSYTGGNATYSRGFTVAAGGGEVDMTTAGQTLSIGSAGISNNSGGNFTIGGAGNTTITGGIGSGSGALIKTGTGTLLLAGTNTYTGGTAVIAGTLQVNTGSGTGTGTVSIAGNSTVRATLGGNGTILGPVTASGTGSYIRPGSDTSYGTIGILKTGNLTIGAGATLSIDANLSTLGNTTNGNLTHGEKLSDTIRVTGNVTLGGNLELVLSGNPTGPNTSTIVLIENDGTDAVLGGTTFTLFTPGNPQGSFAYNLYYTYDTTTGLTTGGNDVAVVFSQVPEPTSLSFLGLGVFGLMKRRRAKSRSTTSRN